LFSRSSRAARAKIVLRDPESKAASTAAMICAVVSGYPTSGVAEFSNAATAERKRIRAAPGSRGPPFAWSAWNRVRDSVPKRLVFGNTLARVCDGEKPVPAQLSRWFFQ
jgi:hypothetical protein